MARVRDYKAEYRRRKERGLARGLSLSQARGHPKVGETHIKKPPAKVAIDPKLEAAFKRLRTEGSLTQAAKSAHVSRERLRRYIDEKGLAEFKGRKWAITDVRPRKVPIFTHGRQREIIVPNLEEASLAGDYWNAAGQFIRSNDIDLITPFRGQGVTDIKGRFHPFETDPNEIHRLAAADAPPFHEIYELVAK